ncbi:unnamed protein product [Strongylus vulgaris]|uniref:Aminoglycoside phosphotransferase domain-containing protein n=1 Tax=Strongylus vulgaris TaxID=40348 RepID=A0A3P7J1A7_STRVU|nr:unnamed protein product [Strongylus vulgaris]
MAIPDSLTEEELVRVTALLRTCFLDIDDFDANVSYDFVVQADNKSFWSKIVRVHLDWKNEELGQNHPKSIFMKYEVSWYQCYGDDTIPHFPMPKFYGAEEFSGPGTGILALEDLSDRVKTMAFFPGLSLTQLERVMDALAGFHYHFISKKDQTWVSQFDRTSEVDQEFQDFQFHSCQMFEKIRPDLFKTKITALKESFRVEAAISAHYSFEELGVPPVPVHYDLNPTNLLWDKEMKKVSLGLLLGFDLESNSANCNFW